MVHFSIDPGLNHCGIAVWMNGGLFKAGLVKAKSAKKDIAARIRAMTKALDDWEFVVWGELYNQYTNVGPGCRVSELPQVYPGPRTIGDPNDLIALALVVGAIDPDHLYKPREWKGNVPKDVMIKRIQSKLSADERRKVNLPSPALAHNVWDAVGIGLHHLKRLK